jgi:RNA polymerase sigma-70 factor, ECF subfamily
VAVGKERGARAGDTESPAVPGADERLGAAAVDGLLRRVARGDAGAFAAVYDQVAGTVYGLVSRIVGDQSRAEQVTAEVLTEVWRSASRFRPAEASGLSWIMTMARRRAISHAGAAADGLMAGPEPSGPAGTVAEQAAESLLPHPGIALLPAPRREAVLLAWCGYTWQQIAELAGAPADTADGRLREDLLGLSNPE